MATKKKAASKSAKKPAAMKPVTQALSKSGLVSHISQHTGVDTKSTRAVIEALEQTMHSAVGKKGAGLFTMPGVFKMSATAVAAKPKRKGIDPFTKEERWFAAKPASVKVKIRPLKKLKDAAI
ncbi:MAG: HU family DNA-binding protein [Rhodanobacteraceae bacterium]